MLVLEVADRSVREAVVLWWMIAEEGSEGGRAGCTRCGCGGAEAVERRGRWRWRARQRRSNGVREDGGRTETVGKDGGGGGWSEFARRVVRAAAAECL